MPYQFYQSLIWDALEERDISDLGDALNAIVTRAYYDSELSGEDYEAIEAECYTIARDNGIVLS